jgi:thioredoxin 1
MLNTNLKHIESDEAFRALLSDNENVMVCCGRMGPMCIPVYDVMEKIESKYPHVQLRDMAFDGPVSHLIRALPEVRGFNSLPLTVYFKNGRVAGATGGIQNKQQVTAMLDRLFAAQPMTASTAM